jgi:Na+-translocating ferredoxin:NAD+ oxidoreductase RNF subunit RnfB
VNVMQMVVFAIVFVAAATGAVLLAPKGHGPEPVDPLAAAVLSVLPGGNCGACGHDSCFDAACAVGAGRAPSSVCVTGGTKTAADVAAALSSAGTARQD